MNFLKKIMLSITMFFMSTFFVSANGGKFIVQICNRVDSKHSDNGKILAYEIDDQGNLSRIIIHRIITLDYAKSLMRALNICFPKNEDVSDLSIDLPLSRNTEKGNRIYTVLNDPSDRHFEKKLLVEFMNLRKIQHIFTLEISSDSSENSPLPSPKENHSVFTKYA